MNNIKNTFRAGFVMAAGLIAMFSCTDTWDDHYSSSLGSLKFNGTTMQALEENAPDFAKVVKAYGFDRELSSDNTYTVWAPADGSFDLSEYVGQNGERVADSTEVVTQFIKNHIALYSMSLTPNDQKFSLLNKKVGIMSASGEFGHVKIDAEKHNISCLNGIIHMVDAPSPYSYNLFEMIAKQYKDDTTEGKDTLSLYAYLYDDRVNKDTLIENKSVSRGVDEDGNKIWVSKYFEKNNTVLKNFDARLYEEDSLFIAIIPSAKAWAERYKKALSLVKFNPSEDTRAAGTVDSLTRHYANSFAMTDLFYNKNANEYWQDSLKSTNYYTSWHSAADWPNHLYYSVMPKYLPRDKEINDILAKCGEPIECSNGTAYIVDEYPFTAIEQFFYKMTYYVTESLVNKLGSGDTWTYTKGVSKTFAYRGGTFSHRLPVYDEDGIAIGDTVRRQTYNYVDFIPTSGNITVAFNLANTLSGTYDIYLVVAPMWMKQDYNNLSVADWDARPYRFTASIFERANDPSKPKELGQFPTKGEVLNNPTPVAGERENIFLSKGLFTDDYGFLGVNDTISLGSYTFKNAYYGRPEYGAMLQIQSSVLSSKRKEFSNEMLIGSIILKPRDGEAKEVVAAPAAAKMRKGNELTTSNKSK